MMPDVHILAEKTSQRINEIKNDLIFEEIDYELSKAELSGPDHSGVDTSDV